MNFQLPTFDLSAVEWGSPTFKIRGAPDFRGGLGVTLQRARARERENKRRIKCKKMKEVGKFRVGRLVVQKKGVSG